MLLSLDHTHQESIPSETINLEPPPSRLVTVLFPPQPKPKQKKTVAPKPYYFGVDNFPQLLGDSLGSDSINQAIESKMKHSEHRVYHAVLQSNLDFISLQKPKHTSKGPLDEEMVRMFDEIHSEVEASIWDGQCEVHKKQLYKKAPQEMESEELIKMKLSLMRTVGEERLSASSPKIKEAQQFVRRVQNEQEQSRKRVQELEEKRLERKAKSVQEQSEFESVIKLEKKELLKRRIQKSNELQILEKQRRRQINSDYLKMIASYRKPLYLTKAEEYERISQEENKRKLQVMSGLRQEKKSVTQEQIKEHLQRYREIQQDKEYEREDAVELRQKEFHLRQQQKYYRGRFHSLLVSREDSIDSREMRKSLVDRKAVYAESVKKNYMPKADERKQKELKELMKKVGVRRRDTHLQKRHYIEEGKRNLQKMHRLIGDLRAKNRLKETIEPPSLPQSPRYKNYLTEIHTQSVDPSRLMEGKDEQWVKMKADKIEESALQKQRYLESAVDAMDFHTHMRQKGEVERDYLIAAKARMAILQKL